MAAQTLIALATYSYLVRAVGAVQVGLWVALMAAGMLACVADLGLSHALIRQLSVALRDPHEAAVTLAQETFETIVATVAAATGIALTLTWLSFPWWAGWTSAPATGVQTEQWLGFVLVGLWLNRVADALAGALDGQQRFVERSLASASALIGGLVLTVALVPRWGMHGFAVAFVVQNALLLVFFGFQLRRTSPGLRWSRPRFRPSVLHDALRYGLSVQIMVVCFLVIESTVKLSLARSGNLAEAAYFDLAFRIGRGVRGLLAAALRVMVPRLAPMAASAGGADRRDQAYSKTFGALQLFSLPIFTAIAAGANVLSIAMLGRHESAFVVALVASLVAWLGYSLTDPAMNLSLSSGRMRWPVLGHVLTLCLVLTTLSFGWTTTWGPGTLTLGLYLPVAMAILTGCLATLIGVHGGERVEWTQLKPLSTLVALAGSACVGLFGLNVDALLPDWTESGRWAAVAAALATYTAMLWLLIPEGRLIRAVLASGFRRKACAAGRQASGG